MRYFFCMFCLWASRTHVSLLYKWMYITSCWSWSNARNIPCCAKGEEKIFQCARIPTFGGLLSSLLCSAETKLSPEKWNSCSHLCQHVADVLRQIPSDLSAGSQTEILTVAQKRTSFCIEILHARHTCEHVLILSFFSSLLGRRTLDFHIAFSMCWLGELLEKRWIIRSGCSNSALHPFLLCFYLTGVLITRHRLLALQESSAILSYFIVH